MMRPLTGRTSGLGGVPAGPAVGPRSCWSRGL